MSCKPEIKYTKLFINGEYVNSASGKTFKDINPADATVITEIQEADKADVYKAVAAARAAFAFGSPWRTMDASQRGKLMFRLADLLERDMKYIMCLETLDGGKPINHAKWETQHAIENIRYCAGWADKLHGKTIPADGNAFVYTRMEPVGVVGMIIPWNAPFILMSFKLGAALATGCTCVIKPAEMTPLTAIYLGKLIQEAGFPPGVVNIVTGFGATAGAALTTHPDVDKLSFTGSTGVGQMIMQTAGLKRISLELGGKSPLVVFDDADLDLAVNVSHTAIFANSGQICFSPTRMFVHEKVYDEFVRKSRELAMKRVLGDPFSTNTQQGPQINEAQFRKVLEYIESGKAEGAKLECGGKRFGNVGYFIEPTIFSNVTDNMTIAREEIFGPVQQILKFKTMDEVIKRANETNFGLAAGVFTRDINKANHFVQAVQAGYVWVNTYMQIGCQAPFGGFKQSGFGREGGQDGFHEYQEIKTITVSVDQKNS